MEHIVAAREWKYCSKCETDCAPIGDYCFKCGTKLTDAKQLVVVDEDKLSAGRREDA